MYINVIRVRDSVFFVKHDGSRRLQLTNWPFFVLLFSILRDTFISIMYSALYCRKRRGTLKLNILYKKLKTVLRSVAVSKECRQTILYNMVKYNRELYPIHIPYKVELVYYLLIPYNQATKAELNSLASTNSMRE